MPTTQEAQNSWAENTTADKWTSGVDYAVNNDSYRAGVADFLGTTADNISATVQTNWQNGVTSQAAQNKYNQNTNEAAAGKWLDRYRAAME